MAGQEGHNPFHADFYYHVPLGKFLEDAGDKTYKLPEYYKRALKDIETKLKSGEVSKKELHNFFEFLEHLGEELKHILGQEKSVGLTNMELERHLRKVTTLLNQVSSLLDQQ
ncbi:hypothetical protein GF396_02865 [Candidatus Pacearchaeota archaeon]|nr:hypothetical protein [Candidatus Pacearchaeota archaeon]